HEAIVTSYYYRIQTAGKLSDLLYINRASDIASTVADIYPNPRFSSHIKKTPNLAR
ncbi:unnamed protein product, partial [marine sediment metagenome]